MHENLQLEKSEYIPSVSQLKNGEIGWVVPWRITRDSEEGTFWIDNRPIGTKEGGTLLSVKIGKLGGFCFIERIYGDDTIKEEPVPDRAELIRLYNGPPPLVCLTEGEVAWTFPLMLSKGSDGSLFLKISAPAYIENGGGTASVKVVVKDGSLYIDESTVSPYDQFNNYVQGDAALVPTGILTRDGEYRPPAAPVDWEELRNATVRDYTSQRVKTKSQKKQQQQEQKKSFRLLPKRTEKSELVEPPVAVAASERASVLRSFWHKIRQALRPKPFELVHSLPDLRKAKENQRTISELFEDESAWVAPGPLRRKRGATGRYFYPGDARFVSQPDATHTVRITRQKDKGLVVDRSTLGYTEPPYLGLMEPLEEELGVFDPDILPLPDPTQIVDDYIQSQLEDPDAVHPSRQAIEESISVAFTQSEPPSQTDGDKEPPKAQQRVA